MVFDFFDFLEFVLDGRVYINVLVVDEFMMVFRFYVIFFLWFLFELFEEFLEVGDLKKLKFVFFFDEVYFLFKDVLKVFEDKIV